MKIHPKLLAGISTSNRADNVTSRNAFWKALTEDPISSGHATCSWNQQQVLQWRQNRRQSARSKTSEYKQQCKKTGSCPPPAPLPRAVLLVYEIVGENDMPIVS